MLASLPRASDAVSDAGGITLVRRLRALVQQAAIRWSSVCGLQRPGCSVNVCGKSSRAVMTDAEMVAHSAESSQLAASKAFLMSAGTRPRSLTS